jgi:hypothetical protein
MSTHLQKELSVVEGSTCNYFHPTWKPLSHTMTTKMLWITSWVPVHSLPWAQCKKWIPIGSMGCVHTHQGGMWLKDVVWTTSKALWRKLGKIIKRLGKLVKLQGKHLPQGWNMIKYKHNGLQMPCKKTS